MRTTPTQLAGTGIQAPVFSEELAPRTHAALQLPAADKRVRRTRRFKLWELQACWHCMVIGTCLTLRDVRTIARKCNIAQQSQSDYQIHRLAVEGAANGKLVFTQRMNKLLEHKHTVAIRKFRSAESTDALAELWKSGWQAGDVAGSLWAVISHPRADSNLIHEVFGEVHMMSHLAGASTCGNRQKLLDQERQLAELNTELANLKRRHVELQENVIHEQAQFAERKETWIHTIAQERATRQVVAQDLNTKSRQSQSQQVTQLQTLNRQLRAQLDEAEKGRQAAVGDNVRLERLLEIKLDSFDPSAEREDLQLCGKCVLFIGGKPQQCRHFQSLVESCEGRFLHHDGGVEETEQRIADLVQQADVVLCPTDCVSHNAMKKARRLCSRQEKPMIFMPRASLSSFTRSLEQLATN